MGNFKQLLKSLDAFPRAEEHLLQKMKSGALVSIVGLVIMATLFLHELTFYLSTDIVHEMAVDLKRGETLPIHINMTFPSLPCDEYAIIALGIMAAGGVFSGANPSAHASEIQKQVEAADAKLIVTDGLTYHKAYSNRWINLSQVIIDTYLQGHIRV